MIAFVDEYRSAYGVEPICKVLPIAPSTYHATSTAASTLTRHLIGLNAMRFWRPRSKGFSMRTLVFTARVKSGDNCCAKALMSRAARSSGS